jgi:hypothetical protein
LGREKAAQIEGLEGQARQPRPPAARGNDIWATSKRFVSIYGSTRCHDIHRHELRHTFDLRDAAEQEAFEAAGAHESKCTGVVARAARWTVEAIP